MPVLVPVLVLVLEEWSPNQPAHSTGGNSFGSSNHRTIGFSLTNPAGLPGGSFGFVG